MPAMVGQDDKALACKLQLPLFAGDPVVTHIYSTKSGAKRLFQAADVAVPVGVMLVTPLLCV